jgi:hypothetical protein
VETRLQSPITMCFVCLLHPLCAQRPAFSRLSFIAKCALVSTVRNVLCLADACAHAYYSCPLMYLCWVHCLLSTERRRWWVLLQCTCSDWVSPTLTAMTHVAVNQSAAFLSQGSSTGACCKWLPWNCVSPSPVLHRVLRWSEMAAWAAFQARHWPLGSCLYHVHASDTVFVLQSSLC